jgi:hypothetical protein
MSGQGGLKDKDTERLLARIEGRVAPDLTDIQRLARIVRQQQARIAALERQRPGPPLEGTAPLPLERKVGVIPGRPGQEINSGGDTFIPPLRPDRPRKEDR